MGYLLICLFALCLGLQKVSEEKKLAAEAPAAEQSRPAEAPERQESAGASNEAEEASSGVDFAFLVVAAGSMIFGIWMGEQRKKRKAEGIAAKPKVSWLRRRR